MSQDAALYAHRLRMLAEAVAEYRKVEHLHASDTARVRAGHLLTMEMELVGQVLRDAPQMPQPVTGNEPAPVGVPSHSSAYYVGRRV
jgi:hypothetical protein